MNKKPAKVIRRPRVVMEDNKEMIIKMRIAGIGMEKIAKALDIGYGSVNTVCKEEGLSDCLRKNI